MNLNYHLVAKATRSLGKYRIQKVLKAREKFRGVK
jgi:hypothetical protein